MIQVQDLSVSYGGETIFNNATLQLQKGERCALVGRNGSGKTTFFRLLTGEEQPDSGSIAMPKGYQLGYLNQHICFSQPTTLEEALLGLPAEDREMTYRAEKILFGLGFDHSLLQMPCNQLSGGFHLRLHLAKALLSEPDCLLLDEPTNYLDILSRRFLMRFLKNWRNELIIISHDREFLDAVATHTLGIHRNTFYKVRGDCSHLLHTIAEEEETYEKTRLNQAKKREHMQSFIDRLGAKATKAAQAQSRKKMLEKMPILEELKKIYNLEFSFREKSFSAKKLLEVKELSFAYNTPLINNVSFEIAKGQRIAIIGKNGYGKSTLLKLLSQELIPTSGTISSKATIGYFGQTNIDLLDPNKTIEEEIPESDYQSVKRICGIMMFPGEKSKKLIQTLSGGERSRVLLGKIVATPCNLLLLDEPTHHLDIESVEVLVDALNRFKGAIVIVTHNEEILRQLKIDTFIVCHKTRQQLFSGTYDQFLKRIGWEEEQESKQKKPDKSTHKEMAQLERTILSLEKTLAQHKEELELVSQENDATHLQHILSQIQNIEEKLEKAFTYLCQLEEIKS